MHSTKSIHSDKPVFFISKGPQATLRLGRCISKILKPNSAIALSGQLGAGKTTLVKGIAEGLGISSLKVNSPSFVLIKEYQGRKLPLFHFDFYRLKNASAIGQLGIEDYFSRGGVLVMEWAKKADIFLPEEYLNIKIFFLAKNKRRFKITAYGPRYKQGIKRLKTILN